MRARIHGYSDDVAIIEGAFNKEAGAFEKARIGRFDAPDGSGLLVIAQYSEIIRNGCWMIGITQIDEDHPIPEWAGTLNLVQCDDVEYSPEIRFPNIPEGTTFKWLGEDEDE